MGRAAPSSARRRVAAVLAGTLALAPTALGSEDGDGVPPLEDSIVRFSGELLGARYGISPLGEQQPPDLDPRFRLDAFDCTTYVETVLALALAQRQARDDAATSVRAQAWLDRIRYREEAPSFGARRHLVESQWIPGLVEQGLVRDVTRELGKAATRVAEIELDRGRWERSDLAASGLDWDAVPHGPHALDYLPWAALERPEIRRRLPHLGIVNVVATPTAAAPTLVIHQALLLRGGDGWIARHASSTRNRVVEEPLESFFAHSRRHRQGRRVLGLNVLAIVTPD